MQGTLTEIDIRSILQLIELGQRTGELFIEAYPPHSSWLGGNLSFHKTGKRGMSKRHQELIWFVFFVNGQIVYAADQTHGSLTRLRDYLRRYKIDHLINDSSSLMKAGLNAPEYAQLWLLLENHHLTPEQGRSILTSMIEETLFDLLSLHQGSFTFQMSPALAPQLLALDSKSLVSRIVKQVQEWKQLHPQIQHPHQCPMITDGLKLQASLKEQAYKSLDRWADGTHTLRQISRYLNRDLLTISKALYPYIQKGWVQLGGGLQDSPDWQSLLENKEISPLPHVLCIDDDLIVSKSVESMLSPYGYRTSFISHPLEALQQVFKLQPDLILCDIVMPELNGYEICAMLRQSSSFRQTPIIMLTGKEGFIDRVRARMVGATDYLTKPFGQNELLMLAEKYLGVRSIVSSEA